MNIIRMETVEPVKVPGAQSGTRTIVAGSREHACKTITYEAGFYVIVGEKGTIRVPINNVKYDEPAPEPKRAKVVAAPAPTA